jgi:hypothetical protein
MTTVQTIDRRRPQTSGGIFKRTLELTVAGGLAFWAITDVFSLLPAAAEFRAALSISYLQMILVEALIGGLIISFCVSYALLRLFNRIPTRSPITKSVILSIVALFVVLALVSVAASRTNDTSNIFVIGALLNLPRFLAIGLVIGYLCKRLSTTSTTQPLRHLVRDLQ